MTDLDLFKQQIAAKLRELEPLLPGYTLTLFARHRTDVYGHILVTGEKETSDLGVALDQFDAEQAEENRVLVDRPLLHDRCAECNKVLHSIAEGYRGTCGSCWFRAMKPENKQALNKLIGMAFKDPKPTDAEVGAAIDDALEAVKEKKGTP